MALPWTPLEMKYMRLVDFKITCKHGLIIFPYDRTRVNKTHLQSVKGSKSWQSWSTFYSCSRPSRTVRQQEVSKNRSIKSEINRTNHELANRERSRQDHICVPNFVCVGCNTIYWSRKQCSIKTFLPWMKMLLHSMTAPQGSSMTPPGGAGYS